MSPRVTHVYSVGKEPGERRIVSGDAYKNFIEWFRYSVPVFTAISLIFVLLVVVAFVMGDSCKITSVKMNDSLNRLYAMIAVSLAAIFTLFFVVVLIVLYSRSRSQITDDVEEPPWIIACLIYWCYPCKKRVLISVEKMEAKAFELAETEESL